MSRSTAWFAGLHIVEGTLQDARHALRQIQRHPAYAAAVFLSLTFGIGATVAVFSVVYGVLLRPLPYPAHDRLVRVAEEHPGAATPIAAELSNLTYRAWISSGLRTLDGLAAYRSGPYLMEGTDEASLVSGAETSPELFAMLGVAPALGRFFAPGEVQKDTSQVVVLSDRLWRNQFYASPGVVGRRVKIDGDLYTIIGVAPRGFAFPEPHTGLWMPFVLPPAGAAGNPEVIVFRAIGRLKPGVSRAQAQAEGTAAARSVGKVLGLTAAFGPGGAPVVRVRPMVDALTTGVRPALLLLSVGIGILLLGVCANVANLFLAWGAARQRELGVRAALGAGSARIARQLVTESLLLATVGGAAGTLLAWALVRVTLLLLPPDFPRRGEITLDVPVLAFAVAVTILTTVVSGLWPAIRSGRVDLAGVTRAGAHDALLGGGRPRGARDTLLASEAAFAAFLLVVAALLARSFVNVTRVDQGFTPSDVLAATIYVPPVPGDRDATQTRRASLMASLLDRVHAIPDVLAAGAGSTAPLDPASMLVGCPVPREVGDDSTLHFLSAMHYRVTPGYGEAIRLRVVEGRLFTDADLRGRVNAWIVNEELVRLYLAPHPTRRRFVWGGEPLEIVGVVRNVLKDGYTQAPQPEIYIPWRTSEPFPMGLRFLVRVRTDSRTVAPMLRNLTRQLAPDAGVTVESLSDRMAASVAHPRFAAQAMVTFAGLAVALASIGLCGVLSYGVSRRGHELGVRAALGARRGALMGLVVREGLRVTLIGLAVGLGAAAASAHLMRALLFGVAPLDPVAFALAPALLCVVAVAAALVPAWRAASIDPVAALRE